MDYYMYQLSCCLYTCIYEGIIYLYFVWKEKVYWQVNWSKRILLCMAFWKFSWRLCIYNFRLICSILSLFFHIFVHSSSFLTPTYSFWGCIAVTISIFLSIHYWDNKLVLPSLSVCMSVGFSFIHLLLGRQHQSGSRFLRHTSEFEILLSMTHSKYNRLGIGHAEVLVPLKQF